jgi:hypothetical protein
MRIKNINRGSRKEDKIKKFKLPRVDKKRKNKNKTRTIDLLRELKYNHGGL